MKHQLRGYTDAGILERTGKHWIKETAGFMLSSSLCSFESILLAPLGLELRRSGRKFDRVSISHMIGHKNVERVVTQKRIAELKLVKKIT